MLALAGLYFSGDFGLRYFYFIIFPVVLFTGVIFGFVMENKRHLGPALVVLAVLVIVCSNIFFPNSFGFALSPPQKNLDDISAPEISFAGIPADVYDEVMYSGGEIVTFYSPHVEWYLRKPDHTIPFSLNGVFDDEISIEKNGRLIDIYSGAVVISELGGIYGKYFFIDEFFASSKLEFLEKVALDSVKKNCIFRFSNKSIAIFECG